MSDSAIKKRLQRAKIRAKAILELAGYEIVPVHDKAWDFEARPRRPGIRRIKVVLGNLTHPFDDVEIAARTKSGEIRFLFPDEK